MAPSCRTAGLGGPHEDAKVRHRRAQRLAIETYAVRAFVATNANLTGADQAERLVGISPGSRVA